MIIIETITRVIIEVIFIEIIGGTFARVNNGILKMRGIETRPIKEIRLDKLKNRYAYKTVVSMSIYKNIPKGAKGIVLELLDTKTAFVEFENIEEAVEIPLRRILLTKAKLNQNLQLP